MQDTLLVLALVTDAFLACFAYGAAKIEIPWRSALLIGGIGTGILLGSMLLSIPFQQILPEHLCTAIGSGLLFAIGVASAFQNALKNYLSKREDFQKRLRFCWAGISFAITVYLDETKADRDRSKVLSIREALLLGAVLSLDSFGTGFSSGFLEHHYGYLAILSLLIHPLVIKTACHMGSKAAGKLPSICSSAGGILLMLLAISRFWG